MDFAQRGSTLNVSASPQYLVDRFAVQKDATFTGTSTYTKATTLPQDAPTFAQSGFNSTGSLKVTNGTGSTPTSNDVYFIKHVIEGYDYAQIHNLPCRFQFWVKSSLAGSYSVSFQNGAFNRAYIAPYTINAANTWEKKTIDLTMDSTGTWAFDNTAGLGIFWGLGIGSGKLTSTTSQWTTSANTLGVTGQLNWAGTTGATFQIAQVMLVQGSFASTADLPFKRAGKTIQQELAMCQRYFEKSYDVNNAPGSAPISGDTTFDTPIAFISGASVGITGLVQYKVNKRAIPNSPTYYHPVSGTVGQWQSQAAAGGTTTRTASTAGQGTQGFSVSVPTSDPRVTGLWAVDAEL